MEDLSAFSARPRLAALLDHFAEIKDTRQAWKVMYPLREVLLLVVCGTIASGDDYDDIVDWGEAHLAFLRGFAEFHFGIPCADWLRTVMNRIDPDLFMDCFTSWVAQCWPDKLDLVAIDGKTSRRTHNRRTGHKALHLVSAFATNTRLVLGQEAVFEKSNEITAIPALVERLDLTGALVSIDAMGCNATIAQSILDAGADYLLAVKSLPPRRRGTTSQRSMARLKAISQPRRQLKLRRSRASTRSTAASKSATTASPIRSIGMRPNAVIREPRRALRNFPPSPWSRAGSNAATGSNPNGAPTSPPARSRLRPLRRQHAATGRSKTSCTGFSM
jgi:DDE_Tnp_1-associated/Transposase DDE domain